MNSFEVYKSYVSLKNHFGTERYEFFDLNGRTKVTDNSYQKRQDKYYFEKISRNFVDREIVDFFVSNFVYNPDSWVGDIIDSEEIYFDWIKRTQGFTYHLKEDLINMNNFMISRGMKFQDMFSVIDNEHPIIFQLLIRELITLETFILLDVCLKIREKFDEKIEEPYIWPKWSLKIRKYRPFVERRVKIEEGKKILLDFLKGIN